MTYGDVWRRLVPEHPDVPALLLRKWLQDAVEDLWRRYPWSFCQRVTSLAIADDREVTCGVTVGSTAVTSAGLFIAGDEYRTFRVGTFPVYTIADYVSVNAITLDRAYEGDTDAAADGVILDAHVICPADWGSWWGIADVDNQRMIPFWFSEEDLLRADPARTSAETPRTLVAISEMPASVAAYAGRARFEWWPTGLSAKTFPAIYLLRVPTFVDTDSLPGVWDLGTSVLEASIAARCARWPGPSSKPNGEFNLALAREWSTEWLQSARDLYREDRNRYPQAISSVQWARYAGFGYTSDHLRASDASAGSYGSGFFAG